MSASSRAKQAGFKSLVEVVGISGYPRRTLEDMSDNKPDRFDLLLLGCLARLEGKRINSSEVV